MLEFLENLQRFSNNKAIIFDDISCTYENLINDINKTKTKLDLSFSDGEVVALMGDFSYQNIATFFALALKKCIIVPFIKFDENNIKSSFVNFIIDENLQITKTNNTSTHKLIQILQNSKHSGLILHSSATTGKAKIMLHNLDKMLQIFLEKKEKKLRVLGILAFDHIGGIDVMLRVLSIGSTLVIPKNKTTMQILKTLEKQKVQVLPASATFLNLLMLNADFKSYDLSNISNISYGAEIMSETLLKKLNQNFKNTKISQKFGTSETGSFVVKSKSNDSLFMKIDDKNIEYKIVENELYLKSKTQILGYLNVDESFVDGWFKTGDLVQSTEEGYLKIIGRSKEIINVGGLKVLPIEIENVILELDFIKDVLVFGEKNTITNESVSCKIILKENIDQSIAKKQILKHIRANLEKHKIPTKIKFISNLELNDRFKKKRVR